MKQTILNLCEKYQFEVIRDRIENLESNITLAIGFLGEFSSGKSTLINALLGRKLLPAMETPTSKSIVEVIPDPNIKDIEFYQIDENGFREISPTEFQEIALGRVSGTVAVKVKPSPIIREGYRIIDTPGLSSLDKTDTDITFGYFPYLDGAVICQDINFGTLTDSILTFLSRPEIRPLADHFLFVLTREDEKDPDAVQKIKEEVVSLLKEKNVELKLGIHDIEKKVITVSALECLNNNEKFSLQDFEKSLSGTFIEKKRILMNQREMKELFNIGWELVAQLEDLKSNMNLDTAELKTKKEKINKDLEQLNEEKREFQIKFDEYRRQLEEELERIADSYVHEYAGIRDENKEELKTISASMINEFTRTCESLTRIFAGGIEIPNLKHMSSEIETSIKNVLNLTELGKLLGTAVTVAAVGPAQGANNLAEAAAGATAAETGNLASKAAGKAAKELVEDSGKALAREGGKAGKMTKALGVLGEMAKKLNPLEYVGDYVAGKLITREAKKFLPKLANKIFEQVSNHVFYHLKTDIFDRIERELKQKNENLSKVEKHLLEEKRKYNEEMEKLSDDITTLRLTLKKMEE